jgi:hypothetical protein
VLSDTRNKDLTKPAAVKIVSVQQQSPRGLMLPSNVCERSVTNAPRRLVSPSNICERSVVNAPLQGVIANKKVKAEPPEVIEIISPEAANVSGSKFSLQGGNRQKLSPAGFPTSVQPSLHKRDASPKPFPNFKVSYIQR